MDYEDVLQEDVLQKAHQKLSELKAGVLFINQVAKKNTAGIVSGGRKAERG